jgi:2,4-dienoyl-CoA reductase (NADPH2)
VRRLPIQVKLNTEVDITFVRSMRPDAVVVATGGLPPKYSPRWLSRDNVLSSHDMLTAMVHPPHKGGPLQKSMWRAASTTLRNMDNPALLRWGLKFNFPFKKKVVIIGGGFAGCELADVLAEHGKKVTLLEESRRLGFDIGITTRWVQLMRLWQFGVAMERNAKVVEIGNRAVTAMVGDAGKSFEADTVALTMPLVTNDTLTNELKEKGYTVYSVGDCAATGGRIMEAMASGFRAGYEI